MRKSPLRLIALAGFVLGVAPATQAATVMQQCGQQYQAAKAAGSLNGMTWTQFRTDCAAKLKVEPAAAAPAGTAAPVATKTANPLNPAPAPAPAVATTPAAPAAQAGATTAAATAPTTGGRAAFVARERQCGTEWKANKTTLIAQTPGLKWPKYLSECNARLKAAGK